MGIFSCFLGARAEELHSAEELTGRTGSSTVPGRALVERHPSLPLASAPIPGDSQRDQTHAGSTSTRPAPTPASTTPAPTTPSTKKTTQPVIKAASRQPVSTAAAKVKLGSEVQSGKQAASSSHKQPSRSRPAVASGPAAPAGPAAPSPAASCAPRFPSTFDVLASSALLPPRLSLGWTASPEELQNLRSSRRCLQVCSSPEELLGDIDHLTYISRGATSLVFHGVWQGADVAVKLLVSTYREHSASLREALLGAEVSHPHVVHLHLARCCKLTGEFLDLHMKGVDMPKAQQALASTCPAPLPKSMYRTAFDSGDGFGPPPSTKLMLRIAEDSCVPMPAPAQAQLPALAPKPKLSPWGGKLTWGHVLTFLNATAGVTLTMIVAEYCDVGTLSSAIHDRNVFNMTKRVLQPDRYRLALRALLRTAREATMGLHHLHMAGIVHGDVKPGNVLLLSTRSDRRGFIAKLTDLGAARVLPQARAGPRPASFGVDILDHNSTAVLRDVDWGTTPYMSPEHFAGFLTPASDMYSLGMTLWEMCHGGRPYIDYTHAAVSQGVVSGTLKLTWTADVPADLVDLISKCLLHSPALRPTTSMVLNRLALIESNVRAEYRQRLIRQRAVQVVPPPVPVAPLAAAEVVALDAESLALTQQNQQQLLTQLQRQADQQRIMIEQLSAASGQLANPDPPAGEQQSAVEPTTPTNQPALGFFNPFAAMSTAVPTQQQSVALPAWAQRPLPHPQTCAPAVFVFGQQLAPVASPGPAAAAEKQVSQPEAMPRVEEVVQERYVHRDLSLAAEAVFSAKARLQRLCATPVETRIVKSSKLTPDIGDEVVFLNDGA